MAIILLYWIVKGTSISTATTTFQSLTACQQALSALQNKLQSQAVVDGVCVPAR